MILILEKNEIAALTLHMSIMRKSVKKGFKKNYGNESKAVLSSYDEVKKELVEALESLGEQEGKQSLHFNIREVDMLHSFLSFYLPKIEEEIKVEKLREEDGVQIKCLENISEKVRLLKTA